jgi:glycosyltransferase involved in cell wall biosynthesis
MASPLKLLHLIPSLVGGGAERQLALLSAGLVRAGVVVHAGYLQGGVNLQPLRDAGVVVHPVRSLGTHDPLVIGHLYRLIRSIEPDVVQTWLTHMDVMGGTAARLARVPHVLSERSSADMYPPTWKNRLRMISGCRAAAVVANSQAGHDYWVAAGRVSGCRVIRNGIELAQIEAAPAADPRELGLPADARLIVYAGRYSEEKQPLQLLDAGSTVLGRTRDVALVFFGAGPLERELRTRAERSASAGRILVRGYTQDLWRWLKAAHVVACPSRFEGNPNVVVESMAAGAPLVVSRIASHAEILDQHSATFCESGSAQSIADALQTVLDDQVSAARRAEAAHARVRAWTVEAAVRQYSALYTQVASGPAPRGRVASDALH